MLYKVTNLTLLLNATVTNHLRAVKHFFHVLQLLSRESRKKKS